MLWDLYSKSGEDREKSKKRLCVRFRIPYLFLRVFAFGNDLWHLYECLRVQFLVSHADESDDFCRLYGICHGSFAVGGRFILCRPLS